MFASPNIINVFKSKLMSWTEHVARMERGDVQTGFWWGNLEERDHLEDLGIDKGITLN